MTKKTLWWSVLAVAGLLVALAEFGGVGSGGAKVSISQTLMAEGTDPGGGGPKP